MSEYSVFWNGAIAAARAREQQHEAVKRATPPVDNARVSVLAHLRLVEDATLAEICAALEEEYPRINQALYVLQGKGLVEIAERTATSNHGRVCRSYRVVRRG